VPCTLELEQGAVKHLSKRLASVTLAKVPTTAPSTFEVGVLRRTAPPAVTNVLSLLCCFKEFV
jgi:hypothetical protein